MKVTHANYGTGTVTSQDENNVTVDFSGEVKTLIIKFAKLTNEDGTPFGEQFIPKVKKAKLNRANFMREKEFANTRAGRMSEEEFDEFLRLERIKNLPSSLR